MKNLKRTFGILAIFTIIAVSTISCDYEEMQQAYENGEVTSFVDPNKTQNPNEGEGTGTSEEEEDDGIGQ